MIAEGDRDRGNGGEGPLDFDCASVLARVALNIAEGELSDPGNQRARFFTAAGSANETLAALRVAAAWGYVATREAETGAALLRRIIAMLWKLTRR